MQKGFIEKFLLLLSFAFVLNNNIYMCSSDICIDDTYGLDTSITGNYFFTKSEVIIDELVSKFESQGVETKTFHLRFSKLKNFKTVIKRLSSYNFKLKSMTYSTLISAFTQIDNNVRSLFDSPIDLLQDDINGVILAFDLLREGIYYELSLEHLLELKKFVIKNLDEIISLIDYWKFKLLNKGIQGHIEGVFQKKDVKIKSKIRNLFYLKNRMATFLGKIEELIGDHFLILDLRKNQDFDFDKFKSFTKESIFCINSFFMQGFNPDATNYDLRLESFTENFSDQSFRKFLANHMNVLLLEKGSRYLLNDYRTPGFLKRNWLKLSIIGTAGMVAGVYFYKNWDDISRNTAQITNDSIDSLTSSYSSFIGMINTKLGLNIPGGKNDLKEINFGEEKISEKVERELEELKEAIGAFSQAGQNLFGQDFEEKISVQDTLGLMAKQRDQLDTSILGADTSVQELAQSLNGFVDRLNKTLAVVGVGEPTDKMVEDRDIDLEELPQATELDGGWSLRNMFTNTAIGEENRKVIQKVLLKVDLVMNRLKFVHEQGLDTRARESLVDLVRNFNEVLGSASNVVEHANGYLKMYEGLAYGMLGVILNSTYNMILSAAKEADGLMEQFGEMANDLQVTANWVKVTVPVILTSVVIPLASILLIRKMFKNKELRRQAEINSTIIDIYRILNVNNKASIDVGIRDLSYEDQGLLAFFVNRLDLNVFKFFKSGKSKLMNLVDDLKNPNFTVAQKLDFIKAGWGYNLFGGNSFGA